MKHKIIFIVGPTASGKSRVAFELAKKINGEIISADSMQVYKDMPIITEAPPKEWMKEVPHHLVGVIEVKKEYSAADFRKRASLLIKNIIKRKHVPIIVGGSGLYIKSLIDGLFPSKPKNEALRKLLYNEAKKYGNEYLYEKLKKLDSDYASKIHPNDLRRIVRALEIYEATKIPFSLHKPKTVGISKLYDIRQFGLSMERGRLYSRIDNRTDMMFEKGLLQEAKNILKKKPSKTVKAAIGLKEIDEMIKKKYSHDFTKDLIKKNTRHFAKRQFTWFRPDKRIKWISVDNLNPGEVTSIIIKKSRFS